MANYTTLVAGKSTAGSIANYVNRGDIPGTEILTEAEALIYETLRVREMTSRDVVTFSSGTQSASLPSGFLDPLGFQPYTWGADLMFVHENALNEMRDEDGVVSSGTPSRWTIIGETAYVDVLPDAAFSGILLFYKTPTALGPSNLTNFLTSRYPTLLRYACMAKAYEHMKDERAAAYLAQTEAEIVKANMSNEMWRRNQFVPS